MQHRRYFANSGWSWKASRITLVVLALLGIGAALAPAGVIAQLTNILKNPGFETGSTPWALCGTGEVVDRQKSGVTAAMVYQGRYALRLNYSADIECGDRLFEPIGAARQILTVPANANDVTISFWYSRVGNPYYPVKINLAEQDGFGFLTELDVSNLPGWHQFRYELTLDQLNNVRGKSVTLVLAASFSPLVEDIADEPMPGFYIDNVRLVAGLERTIESPRPADLRSDGTRPIVYLDAKLSGIARMNADGSGAEKIYNGASTPLSPAWSSKGDAVVVVEPWLIPENSNDFKVNKAQISKIMMFNQNGQAAREILRTTGLPGYRPEPPTAGDPERPALDVTASYVTWAPDDRTIAVSICASNRYKNGSTEDPICWIELFDVATGASKGKFEPGFTPTWSPLNRLLYTNEDAYREKPNGVFEIDFTKSPVTDQLIVAGTGKQFSPSFYNDRSPAWSADGKKFATVRVIDGFHYDENGAFTVHYAIMVFDRAEMVGRQVLLVDQGREPSSLTWSPDGKFLLYTLYQAESADIWWLDLRTGATGRLTTNGASVAADWRASCPTTGCGGASRIKTFVPMIRR